MFFTSYILIFHTQFAKCTQRKNNAYNKQKKVVCVYVCARMCEEPSFLDIDVCIATASNLPLQCWFTNFRLSLWLFWVYQWLLNPNFKIFHSASLGVYHNWALTLEILSSLSFHTATCLIISSWFSSWNLVVTHIVSFPSVFGHPSPLRWTCPSLSSSFCW